MKLTCLLLTLLVGVSAGVQAKGVPFWGAKAPIPYETPTQDLKHGEFTWAPELAPEGPILVVVSLDEQRAYVYRNGVEIAASTISSVVHISGVGSNPLTRTRPSAAKAAIFEPTERKAVTGVGAPSYTSGAHM